MLLIYCCFFCFWHFGGSVFPRGVVILTSNVLQWKHNLKTIRHAFLFYKKTVCSDVCTIWFTTKDATRQSNKTVCFLGQTFSSYLTACFKSTFCYFFNFDSNNTSSIIITSCRNDQISGVFLLWSSLVFINAYEMTASNTGPSECSGFAYNCTHE